MRSSTGSTVTYLRGRVAQGQSLSLQGRRWSWFLQIASHLSRISRWLELSTPWCASSSRWMHPDCLGFPRRWLLCLWANDVHNSTRWIASETSGTRMIEQRRSDLLRLFCFVGKLCGWWSRPLSGADSCHYVVGIWSQSRCRHRLLWSYLGLPHARTRTSMSYRAHFLISVRQSHLLAPTYPMSVASCRLQEACDSAALLD